MGGGLLLHNIIEAKYRNDQRPRPTSSGRGYELRLVWVDWAVQLEPLGGENTNPAL